MAVTQTGPLFKTANTSASSQPVKASTDTTYSAAVGDLLLAVYECNVLSATSTATIADSASNSWTREDPVNAGSNSCMWVFWTRVTSTLATTDTITITLTSAASRRVTALVKISGITGWADKDKRIPVTGTTSPFTMTNTGTLMQADDIAFALHGFSNPGAAGGYADASSGWTSLGSADSGGTVTSVSLGLSYQQVAARTGLTNAATATSITARSSYTLTFTGMTPPPAALVQWTSFQGTQQASVTETFWQSVTTGNTIFLMAGTNENSGASDINTPTGFTLVQTVRNTAGTHVRVKLFGISVADWLLNGYTNAVTVTTTSSQRLQTAIAEFSGAWNLTPEVTNTAQNTTGTTYDSGAVTPLGTGRLVLMVVAEKNGSNQTEGGGWDIISVDNESQNLTSGQKINMLWAYVGNRGASSTQEQPTSVTSAPWAGLAVSLAASTPPVVTAWNLAILGVG